MEKDKKLEELFLAQKPMFDDKADFMATVTRRLDAVEFVRQHQEASLRRYKLAMVAAFIVGIVSGAVTMENSRIIATTTLALLMSFGIMSIFSNVQDILAIRHKSIHIINNEESRDGSLIR